MTGLEPGAVFAGDYRVVRPLSEGGMGAVYVALQISTGKQRALKVMLPQLVADEGLRKRFEAEARMGSHIRSDHVVEVQAAGIDAQTGRPFLVMELLSGSDLAERITKGGPMPLAEMLAVFEQLLHAIAAAHQAQIVHRDLKPENVFLAESQRADSRTLVKVLDFGIAKMIAEAEALSTSTAAIGSPLWMAPEQTERGPVTATADVWALGLIAYYVLTGKVFWRAANTETKSVAHLMREMLIEPIPIASARAGEQGAGHLLPSWFDVWFARCTTRDPTARFADAGAALGALHSASQGSLASHAVTAQHMPIATQSSSKGWLIAVLVIFGGIILLGLGVVAVALNHAAEPKALQSVDAAVAITPKVQPSATDEAPTATINTHPTNRAPHPSATAHASAAPSASGSAQTVATMPPWVIGNWTGSVLQAKTNESYTLGAVIFADGTTNVVDSTNHCAFSWTLTTATATEATFAEKMYKGRCIDDGIVKLTRSASADRLLFSWRGGGETASGELTRKP